MINLDAKTPEGTDKKVVVSGFPDSCPVCHYAIAATRKNVSHLDSDTRLEIIFLCTRASCQSLFIGRYVQNPGNGYYFYSGAFPFMPFEFEFSGPIKSVSPSFCKIYNEAQNAEHQGWKLIAGPGYRKALEFLIKDYLCKIRPADTEKIKNTQLGACIEDYVDNDRVKQMAKRAAWLGNDETHYTRKWEDKDLADLKKVLELTVHWISMEELTKDVVTDMPQGK